MRTATAEETRALGRRIAELLQGGENLLLFGELGAGKTTLVQGLAASLGVTDPVKSPTYTYVREYPLGERLLAHFDLHRLPHPTNRRELEALGLFERLADENTIVVVEWAERLGDDSNGLRIRLTESGDGRKVSLPGHLAEAKS